MTDGGRTWNVLVALGPVVFLVAAALSAGLIMILHPLLKRYALARPNARSSHREPTAQGGGIAVLAATLCGSAIFAVAAAAPGDLAWLAGLFAAAVLLAIVGAVDDVRTAGVGVRLLVQVVAVALVIATLPAGTRVMALPLWIEGSLLLFGGVWFVNLVNFMDGADWMTVAEIVPLTAGLVLIGALGALSPAATAVALALNGAVLGFAPFNRPVARLFLGDVGSLSIGLLAGALLLRLAGGGHLVAAVLLPLYFVADATITVLRRLLAGEPVWKAHRRHFYQQAIDRGFALIEVVARIFAVNLGLVALAAATVIAGSWQADLVALAVGGILVAWLLVTFARGRLAERRPSDRQPG